MVKMWASWQCAVTIVAVTATVCAAQLHERQKIYALAAGPDDWFGRAIALDGSQMVVGTPGPRTAVHMFTEAGGWWSQTTTLDSNDSGFGTAVDLSGDVLIVGAPQVPPRGLIRMYAWDGQSWGETATIWDISDARSLGMGVATAGRFCVAGAPVSGAGGMAYAFEPTADSWSMVAELPASSSYPGQHGDAVATDGNWVVVGGHNGRGYRENTGAAYIYDPTNWAAEPAFLAADDGDSGDLFGKSVGVSGSVAIIGAPSDDDLGNAAGAAYIFRRIGGEWFQHQKLQAPDGAESDFFGSAVAIDGTRLVIGAPGADGLFRDSGKAYYFEESGFEWVYVQTLAASDPQAPDQFGSAVAISGETVIAGAYANDDRGDGAGSVYVFSPFCLADWNADRVVNTQDLIAFLNDWTRRRPQCDVNRDGSVDTQDFLAYLNAWGMGC